MLVKWAINLVTWLCHMLSLAGMCLGLYKLVARVGFELTMTANQPRRRERKSSCITVTPPDHAKRSSGPLHASWATGASVDKILLATGRAP
jgi:hypothetical protein